jgi:hypothetical protein
MGCGVVPSIGERDMWRALRAEIVCWVRFVTVINVFVLERKLGGRDRDRKKSQMPVENVRKSESALPAILSS